MRPAVAADGGVRALEVPVAAPGSLRVVYYPAPARWYTPEEIAEVLGKFSAEDEVMRVLRQVLQVAQLSAVAQAAEPRLSEREAGHAAGRLWELSQLADRLFGALGDGRK